jgi:uncharacterized protein YutE (UPF0331/DUF86 family)
VWLPPPPGEGHRSDNDPKQFSVHDNVPTLIISRGAIALAYTKSTPGHETVLVFDPVDFLEEAIADFLESGEKPSKIGSAVIKVATGVELLLKNKLERICPALILEKIDDLGLQVSKAFDLQKHLINPKDVDNVEVKTANFDTLIKRASRFHDLSTVGIHLKELQKVRNRLVHHKGEVNLLEVNLLLLRHIFPFLEEIGKSDHRMRFRLDPELWQKMREIERASVDDLSSQLAKKIALHMRKAAKLQPKQIKARIAALPEEMDSDEEIFGHTFTCPACKNESLNSFGAWEVDFDDGRPIGGYFYATMRCRVCGLEIGSNEAEYIISEFTQFFPSHQPKERSLWEEAIEQPDYSDYPEQY